MGTPTKTAALFGVCQANRRRGSRPSQHSPGCGMLKGEPNEAATRYYDCLRFCSGGRDLLWRSCADAKPDPRPAHQCYQHQQWGAPAKRPDCRWSGICVGLGGRERPQPQQPGQAPSLRGSPGTPHHSLTAARQLPTQSVDATGAVLMERTGRLLPVGRVEHLAAPEMDSRKRSAVARATTRAGGLLRRLATATWLGYRGLPEGSIRGGLTASASPAACSFS